MLYSSKVLGVQFLLLPRDGRAFLVSRSCAPGILGTQACRIANFIQERRSPERERIGTLNSRSCAEITGHNAPLSHIHSSIHPSLSSILLIYLDPLKYVYFYRTVQFTWVY